MKKILLFIVFFMEANNIFSQCIELIYQNIIVDNDTSAPLWLLENESIYPIQIAQIGNLIHDIDNFVFSNSYNLFVIQRIIQQYNNTKNTKQLSTSLQKLIQKKKNWILYKLSNKKIPYSYDNIKKKIKDIQSYFESYGFLDVKICCEIVINHNNNSANVNYFVKTHKQYTISGIHFMCKAQDLLKKIDKTYLTSIKNGNCVNYKDINNERAQLIKFIHDEGYFDIQHSQINFNICKNKTENTVDIYVQILADKNAKPNKIKYNSIEINCFYKNKKYISTIKDNKFINSNILQKYIDIEYGDFYSPNKENQIYNDLYNTNIFRTINITKKNKDNQLNVSLRLIFNKNIHISLKPNFTVSSKQIKCFINGSLKILNLFHSLDTLETQIDINFPFYNFSKEKKYKEIDCTFDLFLYYPYSYIFTTTNIHTTIGCKIYVHPNSKQKKQKIKYLLQIPFILYKTTFANGNYINCIITPLELSQYKKRNKKFFNPNICFIFGYKYRKFIALKIDLEGGTNYYTTINPYFKFIFEIIPTIYFTKKAHTKTKFKIGSISRKGNDISENILFKIGGNSTLRGWKLNGIGPGDAVAVKKKDRLGDILILINIENVYKINDYFSFNYLFFDIGNIFIKHGDNDLNKYFSIQDFWKKLFINTGLGIRFNFSFLVLRLDIAFILYNPIKSPEIGQRYIPFTPKFNFTFGLPF